MLRIASVKTKRNGKLSDGDRKCRGIRKAVELNSATAKHGSVIRNPYVGPDLQEFSMFSPAAVQASAAEVVDSAFIERDGPIEQGSPDKAETTATSCRYSRR
ncbi:MAG: hypothetical protein R3D44_07205 [Hyphomicrobiaceae bacterium]